MRESESVIAAAAEDVRQACGKTRIAIKVDWSNWEKYDYAKLGKDKSQIIRYVGGLAKSVLDSLVDLCKDADYKAEIAKLTSFNFSGKDDPFEFYVKFSLKGEMLFIQLNGDGVDSWRNVEMLKDVWK